MAKGLLSSGLDIGRRAAKRLAIRRGFIKIREKIVNQFGDKLPFFKTEKGKKLLDLILPSILLGGVDLLESFDKFPKGLPVDADMIRDICSSQLDGVLQENVEAILTPLMEMVEGLIDDGLVKLLTDESKETPQIASEYENEEPIVDEQSNKKDDNPKKKPAPKDDDSDIIPDES